MPLCRGFRCATLGLPDALGARGPGSVWVYAGALPMRCATTLFTVWLSALVIAHPASAQRSLTWRTDEMVHSGVRLRTGRFNQSATVGSEFYLASTDLCVSGISMASTAPRTSLSRTSAWADPGGIFVAINGDFYERIGGSWHVYGDAYGNGLRWPSENSGVGIGAWHWASQNYGWIAVGPGWVDFTHTEYIKENRDAFIAAGYTVGAGWQPTTVAPTPRADTYNLISGFSELVIEGRVYTCPDPIGACFGDRGDMSSRNPRTAIGISADRRTLLFAVVDGRGRRASAGVNGQELAWLMGELGAWQALNLDGGGSSTMWLRGRGIVNRPSDGSERSVLNHVGVFAATDGTAPANCCSDEICNGSDDDCDGVVDNGVLNACGACGPVPSETCNGADDDCDGSIDEGVLNACGGCGPVPVETCDGTDEDCDGLIDEGTTTPEGLPCGTAPVDGGTAAVDGGARTDAGAPMDASRGLDSGTAVEPPPDTLAGACGCRVGDRRGDLPVALSLLFLCAVIRGGRSSR